MAVLSGKLKPHRYIVRQWDAGFGQTKQLWPLEITVVEYNSPYGWELHDPPYLAIEFLLEGELTAEVDNQKYRLNPGDLLLMNKPKYAAVKSGKKGFFRKAAILIQGTLLESVLLDFSLDRPRLISLREPEKIMTVLVEIGQLMERKESDSIHLVNGKLLELLSRISAESSDSSGYPEELNRALRSIENRPDLALSLKELAANSGCSVSTLQRYFQQYCNTTPLQYRQTLKMELAKKLLNSTVLNIGEIAERTGYADQAYFSKDFKKFCGISPLLWRKQHSCLKQMPSNSETAEKHRTL